MTEMTWQEARQQEAEQAAKREAAKRDLVERLAKILAKEFSFQEIRYLQQPGSETDAIRFEAFEIARNKTQGRG